MYEENEYEKLSEQTSLLDIKGLDISEEQAIEIRKEFNDKVSTLSNIDDILIWIIEQYDGKEQRLLLILAGKIIERNTRVIEKHLEQKRKEELINLIFG